VPEIRCTSNVSELTDGARTWNDSAEIEDAGHKAMKAIQVEEFGGPERLTLADVPVPRPGPGEVLVRLVHAGVNYIDVYMRDGSYARSHTYKTPLPMTLGMEGCGRIEQLGDGVSGLRIGEPVAYCLARGSYAEHAVVPAWKVVPVLAGVDPAIATALMLQGSTAHYLTHSAFPLKRGDTCLVHAGAGGVGQLLIQLAKRAGATIIATVGSVDKARIARERGADHVILYREIDFGDEVRRLTDGRGVDVVYDSVGRDTLPRSLRALRRRGVCISFGASSGQPDPVSVLDLAEAGSVFLTRPHLADYMASTGEIRARAADLFAAHRDGALNVAIDRRFPLAQAAAAHATIEGRATRGKLLLDIA
jgi:NADPH2:quinone reductase